MTTFEIGPYQFHFKRYLRQVAWILNRRGGLPVFVACWGDATISDLPNDWTAVLIIYQIVNNPPSYLTDQQSTFLAEYGDDLLKTAKQWYFGGVK